jgi:hypothetical protein
MRFKARSETFVIFSFVPLFSSLHPFCTNRILSPDLEERGKSGSDYEPSYGYLYV